MRYVGRLMSGEVSDWAQITRFFIRQHMQRRTYNREVQGWMAEEGLLLLPPFSTPQSETAKNILQSWLDSPLQVLVQARGCEEAPEDLSDKWPTNTYELTWSARWRKLWSSGGTPRVKLWTWKVLRRAFFTGERAMKLNMNDGTCCRCKGSCETVPHLFFDCRYSQVLWKSLQEASIKARTSFRVPHGLLETIDEALKRSRADALSFMSSTTSLGQFGLTGTRLFSTTSYKLRPCESLWNRRDSRWNAVSTIKAQALDGGRASVPWRN
ncbi:hypothetical protein R1flu_006810 [Riccia fluitans]|uniref:Reverse transcriptase zinc-binding domain-containing protein n=1 Tax=Riccia fluitans TaxID=41844 RepID=A0ABD1YXN7_9MARC